MSTVITAALSLAAAGLLLAAQPAWSQPQIEQRPVPFKTGESSATIQGQLKGDQTIDYTLRAAAGQLMVVKFKPSNPSATFNVLPPGSEEAIFIGSTLGNHFSGELKTDGVHTVRVYLMRSAARRNESTNYTLEVAVSGGAKPVSAAPAANTVAAANKGPARWDASGTVKCSAGSDPFDKACGFRVVRKLSKKSADIWVGNAANGEADHRFLHDENQVFTSDDRSKLAWQRKDDDGWVSVDGKEFYFLPDALIHGG